MATDIPVSVWMQQVLRQSDLIDLALRKSQGKTMTEEKQTLEDISATIIAKAIRNQLAIDQAHLREALTKEVDSSASVKGVGCIQMGVMNGVEQPLNVLALKFYIFRVKSRGAD